MFRIGILALLFIAPVTGAGSATDTWGFFMHRQINRYAVFTLPPEMVAYYKVRMEALMRMAVDPDRRRHLDPGEAPRHYIDLDLHAFTDTVVLNWREVLGRIPEDTLLARGTVPWHIERLRRALTTAFRLRDGPSILRISADLGHYIGDLHVPLHTTSNYDGEQTGQTGVHALWETRLPELFFGDYNLFAGRARYLDNPLKSVWAAMFAANACVDSVLQLERSLHDRLGEDVSGGFDFRASRVQRVYNQRFSRMYHRLLNGMVERQFIRSVRLTGSIWFTCWVDAGQPDISGIKDNPLLRAGWRDRYDSLRRADSLRFLSDMHLGPQ